MGATMIEPGAAAGGAPETGGDPTLDLLQQMGAGDPRMRLLAEMYRARQAAPPEPTVRRDVDAAELAARHARLREAYAELRGQYERLAWALGACARCWGEDVSCHTCRGEGSSGWDAPDREFFARYIVPAVRRTRAEVAGTGRASGAHHAADQLEG